MAGTGDSNIVETRVKQAREDGRIGVEENAFNSEALGELGLVTA